MGDRSPVIVGVADVPLENGRVIEETTPLRMLADVSRRSLAECGLTVGDVDGLLTAGAWGNPGPGRFPTMTLSEYMGLQVRFADSHNVGGSSFEAHVAHAAMAIESGYCDVALIVYGSLQKTEASRTLAGRSPILTMQFESPWGMLTPVGGYALAAHRHMHQYGTTSEQLAEIAVAARSWASLNPAATKRGPLTVDDVLASDLVSDPLHRLDCCLVTDGGGAVVMTTAENARSMSVTPVQVVGYGEAESHWNIAAMPDLTVTTAARSGRRAFEMAGMSPADIDVAEIYDSFTITVLLTLESLGFCGPGEGGAFVSGGRIGPKGEFPMNTNGGGLSYAHPGMYGIFLIIEAVRQLRGEAGVRQVLDARTALVNGTGGTLSSTGTCILATGSGR